MSIDNKMKIGIIAPIWEKVPPKKYGGTELVVYNLTEELVKRGHQVTLFASGDSQTSARLISVVSKTLREMEVGWDDFLYPLLNTCKAFDMEKEFDIYIDDDEALDFYDMELEEAVTRIIEIKEKERIE